MRDLRSRLPQVPIGKGKGKDKGNSDKGKGKGKEKEDKGKGKGNEDKGKGTGKSKEKGKDVSSENPLVLPDGRRICVFYQVGQCGKTSQTCPNARETATQPETKRAAQSLRDKINNSRPGSQAPSAPATEDPPKKQGSATRRRSRRAAEAKA